MKRLSLCADDFGQSPGISNGILELLDLGRLQAISCMTESPHWQIAARTLKAMPGNHEVGLHFNLTHVFVGKSRSIGAVMAAAWLRTLDPAEVAKRFETQWDAFVDGFGRAPDYVDGHQHVHAFPVIRNVVADRVKALAPSAWVRSLGGSAESPKQAVLAWADRGLVRALGARGLRTNAAFAGLRPYRADFDFRQAFRRWLAESRDGTLIMSHPGQASKDGSDPIAACRPRELDYLRSDDFKSDCREMGVVFRKLAPS